ncbi:MAG TPA: hypothetical protein VFA20_03135 [Myxococcaceae bacterium]|nr:hypothetical protein [Myxococcaceae bacterium]
MTATNYFESLGFTLGVGLGKARAATARAAAFAAQANPRPLAPGRKRTGPLGVGDQVIYRQGRGQFVGMIVRKALDGRFVVSRTKDGKRVLRPADLLKRTP